MRGGGSNTSLVRNYNERAVLLCLHQTGTASKREIADHLNLTPQAIVAIVDSLENRGLVKGVGKRTGGVGQPSTLYAINPDGAFSIGVKVGRRNLNMVLANFAGEILLRSHSEYAVHEPESIMEAITDFGDEVRGQLSDGESERLTGLGLSAPYFIEHWHKELDLPARKLDAWRTVNLVEDIAERTGMTVYSENDGTAAAIGEFLFGVGRNYRNFLYIFVGTFVGGGIILDGQPFTGPNGNAGALGPLPVPPSKLDSAQTSAKGGTEYLLHRASVGPLLHHLRHHGFEINSVSELPRHLDAARPLVQEWLEDCCEALVWTIQSLIAILDVEAVIIDGNLTKFLLAEIVDTVDRRMKKSAQTGVFLPSIVLGEVGAEAGAVGAAILPLFARFSPDRAILTNAPRRESYGSISPSKPDNPDAGGRKKRRNPGRFPAGLGS
ncbi:MAG: ROK family transcriptional regulator [Rhodospirillales bacterium]|nr:ROK family transcriptional regulator [Rhodospirillales bacterium]